MQLIPRGRSGHPKTVNVQLTIRRLTAVALQFVNACILAVYCVYLEKQKRRVCAIFEHKKKKEGDFSLLVMVSEASVSLVRLREKSCDDDAQSQVTSPACASKTKTMRMS